MVRKRNSTGHLLILVLMLGITLSLSTAGFACWGIPLFELIVENQTEHELTIYMNDYEIGSVSPGQVVNGGDFRLDVPNLLTAKNTEGETVFIRKYYTHEMQGMLVNRVWTVVIPPSETLYGPILWAEYEGVFHTKDLARAQEEIPFTIVLPDYIPGTESNTRPEIRGPLREYQPDDNRIRIEIAYCADLKGKESGCIFIEEYNYPVTFADPESDPVLEYIEVKGIRMVKTIESYDPSRFTFNYNDIYFAVQFFNYNLPLEEAIKVIESMVK